MILHLPRINFLLREMTKENNDHVLLALIKNDDQRGLDRLFLKYHHNLVRYGKYYLPYPSDEAEDIVLEIFFKIWQQRHQIIIQTSLSTYLYISVKNRIVDHLKKKRIEMELINEQIAEEIATDRFPDEQLIYREQNAEINRLISLLPETTQLVFRMNRHDELSYNEIAKILNVSINTVKTLMYRALKFLKDSYHSSNNC